MEVLMGKKTNKEGYEIVKGDGDLNISPVYSHVNINKKTEDPNSKKNIIIPSEKK